jgi:hypothetical protein
MKKTLSIGGALLALTMMLWVSVAHAQAGFRGAASAARSDLPVFRAAASAAVNAQIAFRAASSATTTGSSLVLAKPAGTTTNDVLIAAVAVRPSSATIGTPTGWTLVRRTDNTDDSTATSSLAVFRRLADGSEPSSYTWDVTGATEAAGGIQAFANVDPSSPIEVEDGQSGGGIQAFANVDPLCRK